MKQVIIMPGGFHPFHAGHYALYQQAQDAFPWADVYVAATNDTSTRPFPFAIKEKLAKLAGVKSGHFVQVKSPFQAREITANLDPANTQLIFVRSEKDANKPPQAGGVKKDGNPAYLQPLEGQDELAPMNQHAYMAYLPTVEFGPGMTSATEIRTAWPRLNEKRKTALVMSLYPKTQGNLPLATNVVKLLDAAMGTEELNEFSFGGDDDDTPKDDPYKYPKPEQYRRSIDFFGKFEANHFDKEDMNDATGEFKGYWYYDGKPRQIAYFKFNNPQRTGSNDPGMGWYYEPQDEDIAEGEVSKKDIAASKKKIDAKRTELEKQGVKKSQLGEPSYHLDAELRNANKQGVAEVNELPGKDKVHGATATPAPSPALKRILMSHIDELREFVKYGELDPTGDLFFELAEHFMNEIPIPVRQDPLRLERRIRNMIAPYAKFYATAQNMNEDYVDEKK